VVVHHHVRATLGEAAGDALSDPAVRTGDQGDLSVNPQLHDPLQVIRAVNDPVVRIIVTTIGGVNLRRWPRGSSNTDASDGSGVAFILAVR
jgi:hypothetical protein